MTEVRTDRVVVTGEGVRVDLMLARRDRAYVPGLLEKSYEINPGLAELGPVLPVGTVVDLPVRPADDETAVEVIRLWD